MVITLLTTHAGSHVHSRGRKLGTGLKRRKVAWTRLCCVAGTVPGISLASCSLMFAATTYEGGGGSYVFLVKDTGAQGSSAPSPQSLRSPTPACPSAWPSSIVCWLFPSCVLTLVLLTGAVAQWCLCNRSSSVEQHPVLSVPMVGAVELVFPQDLAMGDLGTGRTTFCWNSPAAVSITTSFTF